MIVCADDYGFAGDIDSAILELCASGKLSAVSCATALEECNPQTLKALREHEPHVDIGLHLCFADEALNVTDSAGRTAPRLPPYRVLLRQAMFRRISPAEIAANTAAQYGQFLEKCGRKPDFIDGHLHAHQLPGIRDGLIEFVQSLPIGSQLYIRNTSLPLRELRKRALPQLKAAAIGMFGTRMLAELRVAGFATNPGFAGIYDFRQSREYPHYLPRFVDCLNHPNGILVVHPGRNEEWRRQELEALRAFNFPSGTPNRFRWHG